MKKIRMGLMALAAVSGVGSAFAFNHPAKHKQDSKTYYAVISGGVQRWQETPPNLDDFSCQTATVACTITSTSPEADVLGKTNGYPANFTIQSNSGNHAYQLNP